MNTPTDPAQLTRRAEDLRQQAAELVRFIRQSDTSFGAMHRRRRANELYRQADDLDAFAETRSGGAQ